MQPTPEHLWFPDRVCFSGQDQEHGLKSILGILTMTGHAATDTQDDRTIPGHEFAEGRLILFPHKSSEQLAIGRSWLFELSQDGGWPGNSHRFALFPY
jgi:hypothetical protein